MCAWKENGQFVGALVIWMDARDEWNVIYLIVVWLLFLVLWGIVARSAVGLDLRGDIKFKERRSRRS